MTSYLRGHCLVIFILQLGIIVFLLSKEAACPQQDLAGAHEPLPDPCITATQDEGVDHGGDYREECEHERSEVLVVGYNCYSCEYQRDEVGKIDEENGNAPLLSHLVCLHGYLVIGGRFTLVERGDTQAGYEVAHKTLDKVEVEAGVTQGIYSVLLHVCFGGRVEEELTSDGDAGHDSCVNQEDREKNVLVDVDEGSTELQVPCYGQ